jgi:hypothetical protein
VLIESCLIKDPRLGTLHAPLSSLVYVYYRSFSWLSEAGSLLILSFHFDTAAGGGSVQPSEAAYVAALDPSRARDARPPHVTVLVL